MTEYMPTLEEATVKQIVDELARRFTRGLIVAGVRDAMGKANNGDEEIGMYHRNGFTVCIGIAERMKCGLLEDASKSQEYVDDDGEDDG